MPCRSLPCSLKAFLWGPPCHMDTHWKKATAEGSEKRHLFSGLKLSDVPCSLLQGSQRNKGQCISYLPLRALASETK